MHNRTKKYDKNHIPGLGLESISVNDCNEQTGDRPQYALINHEDEMYHEFRPPPRLESEPEYCAFFDKVWVFNRKMEWIHTQEGNVLCYSKCGNLFLTGENQASKWFSDKKNTISHESDFTSFVKYSEKRYRDCIVLPAFQFNINQHPEIELDVMNVDSDWQFCVFVKGRSGAPLISSNWENSPAQIKVNIKDELHKKGYNLHFAELHFVLGIWSPVKQNKTSLKFRLKLCSVPAIVPCLPVVRSIDNTASDGIPVSAILLDASGLRVDSSSCILEAIHQENSFPLSETNGLWTGLVPGLAPGEYNVKIVSKGIIETTASLKVRVTDGNFLSFNAPTRSLEYERKSLGPLSGSYQGIALFKNVGMSDEEIVQGQTEWDTWDRNIFPGEHWHYWEAMTEEELEQRFAYLKKCGWNLLHLCQHFAHWERLDAGGRIAPHGAEQLALYLRVGARHKLKTLLALTHYPYSTTGRTKVYSQYIEAGLEDEDWGKTNHNSVFNEMFHHYLSDVVTLFKEETAIFAFSTSGEGDVKAGKDRVNMTFNFISSLDKNHLFIAEPIHHLWQLPYKFCKGWEPEITGSRTYWIGYEFKPDIDLAIEYKLMRLGNFVCMAEGCWPCQPLYAAFAGIKDTWCGSIAYRTRVRDTLYLGLIYRSPLILTWDEQITEDERIIFDEVRKQIDWDQDFMEAPVAIIVDDSSCLDAGKAHFRKGTEYKRDILFRYESFFSAMVLETRYSMESTDKIKAECIIDARQPFTQPHFRSKGGYLSEKLKTLIPMEISDGYSANYLWSEDRKTFLAYIRNSGNYIEKEIRLGGKIHRIPIVSELIIKLKNFPNEKLQYFLYDLEGKTLYRGNYFTETSTIEVEKTSKDFLVAVLCKK